MGPPGGPGHVSLVNVVFEDYKVVMVGGPSTYGCRDVGKSESRVGRESSRKQKPKVQVDSPRNPATRHERLYT